MMLVRRETGNKVGQVGRSSTATGLDRYNIALALLLLAVASTPLLLADYPPLVDYPNHLARAFIIAHYDEIPDFRDAYRIEWQVLPNLAMDVFVPFLGQFTGVPVAGRAFIFMTFSVLLLGSLAVNSALYGRVTLGGVMALAFLYNSILIWGFLNYLFGLGIALLAFAAFMRLYEATRWTFLVGSSSLSLLVFFCHLYAFAIYGILVIAYTFYKSGVGLRRESFVHLARNLYFSGVQAIVPLALFLFFSPVGNASTEVVQFGSFRRKLDGISYFFSNYNESIDILAYSLLAGLVGYLAGTRVLSMNKVIIGVLALLVCLYVSMPAVILSSSSADRRLIVALAFVFTAGSCIRVTARREWLAVAAVISVITILQAGITGRAWAANDTWHQEYTAALEHVGVGSKVALAIDRRLSWHPVNVRHLPSLLVVERQAFAPNIFAIEGQQPLALRPDYRKLVDEHDAHENFNRLVDTESGRLAERLERFDYLLVFGRHGFTLPESTPGLVLLERDERFALYRLI